MPSSSHVPLLRAIGLATLVAVPFQPAHAQGAGDPIFHHYRVLEPTIQKATKALSAHQFDEARQILDPVLKEVPDHAQAHFLLASMAYQDRDFAGALAHIETSEASLKDLNARYAKVLLKRKDDDAEDARVTEDSLRNLVDAGYDSIDDILGDKRRHLKSLEAKDGGLLNQDVAFAVPAAYSLLHGNCLFRLGRAQEAAAQYQRAVQSDPKSTRAWNNLVNLYWVEKDFGQARATLAKAEAAGVEVQPKLKQSVLDAK